MVEKPFNGESRVKPYREVTEADGVWIPKYKGYPETQANGEPWPKIKIQAVGGDAEVLQCTFTVDNREPVNVYIEFIMCRVTIEADYLEGITQTLLGNSEKDSMNHVYSELIDYLVEQMANRLIIKYGNHLVRERKLDEILYDRLDYPRP